jgi:putative membrane protein
MHQKIIFATAAVASLSVLAACGQKTETGAAADQQNQPVNVAQDVAGAATGVGTAAVGAISTDVFLRDAAMGDMYEIQAANMAVMRAKNPEVKSFAQMMIKDHTNSSNKLKMLVSGGQVKGTLPTELDERRKGMLDNLRGAPDADFDARYIGQQRMAHHEMLLLMNGYKTTGTEAPLKAFAAEVAPIVQMHTDMAAALDNANKGDKVSGGPGLGGNTTGH